MISSSHVIYNSVIVYSSSSWSITPTHSRVGIVLCVAVVTFDLSGGWDLLISGSDGLVGSGCTLTLVSKGNISRNSPVCEENDIIYFVIYDKKLSVCLITVNSYELVYILNKVCLRKVCLLNNGTLYRNHHSHSSFVPIPEH